MDKGLAAFEEFLKKKGLKSTHQRRLIVEKVFSTHTHFSVEGFFESMRKEDSSISRATVYRTLSLLTEGRLLEPLDFGKGYRYYEHILGHSHHDHLVCIRCGRITEFEDDTIEKIQGDVSRKMRFKPMSHSLKIFGRCRRCSMRG